MPNLTLACCPATNLWLRGWLRISSSPDHTPKSLLTKFKGILSLRQFLLQANLRHEYTIQILARHLLHCQKNRFFTKKMNRKMTPATGTDLNHTGSFCALGVIDLPMIFGVFR
jgi:hypothetical protein